MHYSVVLPEPLYQQVKRQAQQSQRSVEDVVTLALQQHLPPTVADTLPHALQKELQAMSDLSDATLWQIAASSMNTDKVAMYDLLLERHANNSLTPEGRQMLDELRLEADALTLRKAQAYALLQSRGHRLPTLEELQQTLSSPE
jgi:hypothetical protein